MTKCEKCGEQPVGEYGLHDYCAACSKNLCDECMASGRCRDSDTGRHVPANHGERV